jgi:hypothetical protein
MKKPSERDFLRQRLELVEERLTQANPEFIYAGNERVRRETRPSTRRDTIAHREVRLLRKLLTRVAEGQGLIALAKWRQELGGFLKRHRLKYRQIQKEYDDWSQLPPNKRQRIPAPPKPPPARFIDKDGAPWIIDDRFLELLDDLAARLRKWLGSEENPTSDSQAKS